MRKSRKIIFYYFLVLIMVLIASCKNKDENHEKKAEEKNRVTIEVMELKGENYISYISVIGTVKPFQKALIASTEGGKIEKYYKDKGDFVRKGDTILVIDNDILFSNMQAAKAQYDLAKITYEKQKMIYDENVNSEIQYLQSKFNMQQAEANYNLIRTRYNNTFIIAPFSGYIDAKYFDENEIAPAGNPIVLLIDISKVKIQAGVPEKYISLVKKGNNANIEIRAINKNANGKISFVGTSVNTNNRTFPIEITIQNKDGYLKPELIAEVKIKEKEYDNIIVIPNEIISRIDDGYRVYVVENGVAVGRNIQILSRSSNRIAVSGGLNVGEKLVVVGYQNLVDGQAVKVIKDDK